MGAINKLNLFCEENGISAYKISQLTGISQPAIRAILNGESSPSLSNFEKICAALNLDIRTLFSEEKVTSSETTLLLNLYNNCEKKFRDVALYALEIGQPDIPNGNSDSHAVLTVNDVYGESPSDSLIEDEQILTEDTVRIPFLGISAAGTPIEMIEDYDEISVALENNYRLGDFAVTASGDSMIDCGINNGDKVLIRSTPHVDNGEIALVAIDNGSTIKKFYKKENQIILKSCNKNYEDQVYTEQNTNSVRILGKFICIL